MSKPVTEMSKAELIAFAKEKFNVNISTRKGKADVLTQVQGMLNEAPAADAAPEAPAADAAPEAPAAEKPKVVKPPKGAKKIAKGKSLTTRKGIMGEDEFVTADIIGCDKEAFNKLVKRGVLE